MSENRTTTDASFVNRCERQVFSDHVDLSDEDRLRLWRLAGNTGDPPRYRIAWPPYAEMIAAARRGLADGR